MTTSSTAARRSTRCHELLGLELPDEEWDTVGGFVFGTLEHVPEVGESVVHDHWRFTVIEVDGRRVRSLRISDLASEVEAAPPPQAGGADAAGVQAAHDVASPG